MVFAFHSFRCLRLKRNWLVFLQNYVCQQAKKSVIVPEIRKFEKPRFVNKRYRADIQAYRCYCGVKKRGNPKFEVYYYRSFPQYLRSV